jgi:uncharacterized repeat protein (TIGR03847 family)
MPEFQSLQHVDWATAGALGDPGQRTFYLQAREGTTYLGVTCEKEQVAALADVARQVLAEAGEALRDDEIADGDLRLAPVVPLWRVGAMALGHDPDTGRYLLRLEELAGDGVVHLVLDRDGLSRLAADALHSLDSGARHRCRFCDRPLDPDSVHLCPEAGDRPTFTV